MNTAAATQTHSNPITAIRRTWLSANSPFSSSPNTIQFVPYRRRQSEWAPPSVIAPTPTTYSHVGVCPEAGTPVGTVRAFADPHPVVTTGLAATSSPTAHTANSASSVTRSGAKDVRRTENQADRLGMTALITSAGTSQDVEALRALIVERDVERVVVGLPLHMDGRAGPEAEAARRFAAALGEAAGIPVDTLDERWTTREAERALHEGGTSKKSRRKARKSGERDSMAAAIILRTWLERETSR